MFTVAPRSVAALVPPRSSLQIQILCDQKMRRFLPALRHRPLFKNAPCECTLDKLGLHFRHWHQRTKHVTCQCLQRSTSWRTVAVPRKINTTAATANLSSTRVRPHVTTSPDNHQVQAPRHPAPKSEALCEILDLLDGPLSFLLTFFSWLIILVQLPKSCRPSSQYQHQFRSSQRSSTMFKNNLSLLILAQTTRHSTRRAALIDNVVL